MTDKSEAMLADGIEQFDKAKSDFAATVLTVHATCQHSVWIERGTHKIIEWGNPLSAIRICKACRAEIRDRSIYGDWLSEYSAKPTQVGLVLTPEQVGLTNDSFFKLRLEGDPRPQFTKFSDVTAYKPEQPQ